MSSDNSNCLIGMRCPECGSFEPFRILSTCAAVWTDGGVDGAIDFDYDDDALCECLNCGNFGEAREFYT